MEETSCLAIYLYMNKLHHRNQWNTNFLLICIRFANANLCMFFRSKNEDSRNLDKVLSDI